MKIVKLNEIAVCNKDNFDFSNVKGVINYLDTSSITDNSVSSFTKYENYKNIPSRAKRAVSNGTIVYSNVRPILRHIGILSNLPQNVVVSTGFTTIDVNEQKIDPYYLYYVLSQDCYTQYLSKIANSAVSAYPSITVSDLSNLKLTIFEDLSYQKKLGQLLKDIDKKIQNNKKQIETLENLAKTIYNYWFVQFDFPNEEGKPYKSSGGKMVWNEELKREIPEGWNVGLFDEYCKIFTGKKDVKQSLGSGKYKFYSCAPDHKYSNDKLYEGKAILISGNGSYTGRTIFVEEAFDLYQRTYACVDKTENSIIEYLYLTILKFFVPIIQGGTHGSAIPYIVYNDIAKIRFAMNKDVIEKFQNKAVKILKKINNKKKENLELNSLRLFLLPFLMNGQVKV